MRSALHLDSLRPLVRYVDDAQAVIDAHFQAAPPIPESTASPPALDAVVDVHIEVDGEDGFHDEGDTRMQLKHGEGSVRFEVVQPHRWWPAGMGEQPLYLVTVTMLQNGHELDSKAATIGLTSVRRDAPQIEEDGPTLLVNGQVCDISHVVPIDRIDENALLPVSGRSLLLVRDHYGPENLYDAADRAGILLVQCVPVDEQAAPDDIVSLQVERLASHPSLAGYYVGHLGDRSDAVAQRIRMLDPTRSVFRSFPVDPMSLN